MEETRLSAGKARSAHKSPKQKKVIDDANLRRSNRARKLPAPVYTTFDVDEDLGDARAWKKTKRRSDKQDEHASRSETAAARKPSAPPSANSIRALRARLWEMYTNYLGERVEPPEGDGGLKAAVVKALSPVHSPKFSKMSGIQEWKNCVVLYVNVGDKHGNTYDNVFTGAGSRISWFAQTRQDEESSAIKVVLKTMTLEEESVEDAVKRAEDGDD